MRILEQLRAEDPSHGPARYLLARYRARTGGAEAALALLEELLAIEGWDYRLEPDDFPSLQDDPAFAALQERAASVAPTPEHGPVAFELDRLDVLPEGVAWDAKRRELLFGSFNRRQIFAADEHGKSRPLVQPGQDGLMAVLGLAVDATSQRICAASVATPMMEGFDETQHAGKAAVFCFDLESGETVGTWPAASTPSQLNDLIILSDGRVLVTDSITSAVLEVPPGSPSGTALVPFVPEGAFFGPNGLVELEGETAIVVADFHGLHRVDLETRDITDLDPPPGILTLSGIDGLARRGRTLIGIQNLFGPGRVWAVELDAGSTRLVDGRLLDDAHPRLKGPTTGAVDGDRFLYLGNASLQWGREGIQPAPEGQRHVILELSLG